MGQKPRTARAPRAARLARPAAQVGDVAEPAVAAGEPPVAAERGHPNDPQEGGDSQGQRLEADEVPDLLADRLDLDEVEARFGDGALRQADDYRQPLARRERPRGLEPGSDAGEAAVAGCARARRALVAGEVLEGRRKYGC